MTFSVLFFALITLIFIQCGATYGTSPCRDRSSARPGSYQALCIRKIRDARDLKQLEQEYRKILPKSSKALLLREGHLVTLVPTDGDHSCRRKYIWSRRSEDRVCCKLAKPIISPSAVVPVSTEGVEEKCFSA
ncbi:hypothetical protein Pst134EA_011529 [Puccinia striiformis f. sp. tritici]|uniref:hypothetical protein n=1 Tax=Puccinia striiformis f. sp. tritici TaxID=168172 RepID=UPI002008EAAE|nr:hypothetical protein Pst134EA_011529 [Puccinia striiformis f. sp. tritici]KAH9456309.1 hypothetical protein Pst134EB_012512 [Puccinia striiformis f. sp. tritici]KAH9467909.1 hypothetical protein Pst134EA_011529 [Puccinia striiformis f. sp. tritici]